MPILTFHLKPASGDADERAMSRTSQPPSSLAAIGTADLSAPTERGLECGKCGTVAVNRDFCPCGEYLSWELTTTTASEETAAPEPAAYRQPEPEDLRDWTVLTLRDPARLDDPNAAIAVSVEPGAQVSVLATIRNQGRIVDTFDLRVEGLPDPWWTISPATVFLNPLGTTGDYEQQVEVRLHPPRAPESEARSWPLTIVARSRSAMADVVRAPATLTVRPFQSTVMHVGPERRLGRRNASFDVAVENHGNSPMEIAIGGKDAEARCPVGIAPRCLTVPIGRSGAALVSVAVPRPLIFGRPVDHFIDVTHRAIGVDSDPLPQRVTFRQKPWLPWWIPPALAMLAAFIVAVLLLRHDPEVPKLEGDTVEEALVVLNRRHLELGRTTYETAPKGVTLNTIMAQEPAPGADIDKGEPVNITLAAAPTAGIVPPVNGRTLAEAADALKAAKFGYNPQPSSAGNDWVVIRQEPTPGTKLTLGAQVTLAVENRTPAATPTPNVAPSPSPSVGPASTAAPKPASSSAAPAVAATSSAATKAKAKATVTPRPALPADFVFAGATSGQLYRWTHGDAKPARLTPPKYWLETPAKIDDGYVAVQVENDARRLARISTDGKTVVPIAEGKYHRPAYAPSRGLLGRDRRRRQARIARRRHALRDRPGGRRRAPPAHPPPRAGAVSPGPRGHRAAVRCSCSPARAAAPPTNCSPSPRRAATRRAGSCPRLATGRPPSSPRRGSGTTVSPSSSPITEAVRRTCDCSPAARTAASGSSRISPP